MRLSLFEDLFVYVLLALFKNKLNNIFLTLVFYFVDLFWAVAPILLFYLLFILRIGILSTLAHNSAQKVIILVNFLIGNFPTGTSFDHSRSYAAIMEWGHAVWDGWSAHGKFSFICVCLTVECMSFHICFVGVGFCVDILTLDVSYLLKFIIHVINYTLRIQPYHFIVFLLIIRIIISSLNHLTLIFLTFCWWFHALYWLEVFVKLLEIDGAIIHYLNFLFFRLDV